MFIISITISLIAVLLSVWIGRRNPVRSSGLTSGMLVLLMFIPLLFLFPKIEVSWLDSELLGDAALASPSAGVEPSQSSSLWLWSMSGLWMLGSVFLLLRLARQCHTVKRWCNQAEPVSSAKDHQLLLECATQLGLKNTPEVRYTTELHSPVITGLLNPVLLLPSQSHQWSQETLRMVILHELGHFQRKDLWTNMAAHMACAFHWFNPLVWILRKRLLNECEYACDAHVIAHGTNTKTYVNALCDVAENCRQIVSCNQAKATPATVLAMANQASLKNRVANVLDGQPKNCRWVVIGILGLSASATFAFSLLRPQTFELIESLESSETSEQQSPAEYSKKEINKRLSANPFPAE